MVPRVSERAKRWGKAFLVGLWVTSGALLALMIVAGLVMDEKAASIVRSGGPLTVIILAAMLSFVAEYVDSSLGMGYGTTLTPTLLLLGFEPLHIVPAILVQELVSGTVASVGHYCWGNVELRPGLGVALILGTCGVIGGLVAGRVAVEMPQDTMRLITGGIVISMGFLAALAATGRLRITFTWARAAVLGLIAALNKGFMGGGYGPIVTSGQIVAGANAKSAVAITSASELLTCAGGLVGYALGHQGVDWRLAGGLILGGTVAALLASPTVRVLPTKKLTAAVACACFALGAVTLVNALR